MGDVTLGGSREAKSRYYEKNKDLCKARSREWRSNNRERYLSYMKHCAKARKEMDPEEYKKRARGYALKRKYGISLEQYEELLNRQNRCCAICERHESEFNVSMAVDHDHSSGRIRGILCTHCNYRMVAKHKDGDLLRKIADYIEQGTDWFVPKKQKKRKKSGKARQQASRGGH